MKKSLLALGAITAVAVPVVATVSCGLGNVLKNKIYSAKEAEKVVSSMLKELSNDGTYHNDLLYYQEYGVHNSGDNVWHDKTFTKEDWKGIQFDINQTKFWDGQRVFGWQDWSGTHNWMWSSTPVTLANGTQAQAVVLYKYEKTHGTIATNRTGFTYNAVVGFANLIMEWKHLIYGIALIPQTQGGEQAEDAFSAARH